MDFEDFQWVVTEEELREFPTIEKIEIQHYKIDVHLEEKKPAIPIKTSVPRKEEIKLRRVAEKIPSLLDLKCQPTRPLSLHATRDRERRYPIKKFKEKRQKKKEK